MEEAVRAGKFRVNAHQSSLGDVPSSQIPGSHIVRWAFKRRAECRVWRLEGNGAWPMRRRHQRWQQQLMTSQLCAPGITWGNRLPVVSIWGPEFVENSPLPPARSRPIRSLPTVRATQTRNMSAPEDEDKNEVTLRGGDVGLEGEELAGFGGTGLRGPSAPGGGLNLGVLLRNRAEGGFQGPWGSEWEPEDLAVGEAVLYGQESPLGTSVNLRHDKWDEGSDPVALVPPTTQESGAASMPQVLYPEAQDVEGSPSPVSCWDEDSTPWRGLNSVTCARAPFPQGHGEARPPLANPPLLPGCKGGRGGRMIGGGSRSGWSSPRDKQGPFAVGLAKLPSEPESLGDFGERQRVRDGRTASRGGALRGRGPTITHGPVSSSIAGRQSKLPWRENVLSMRGSTPPSLPRRGPTSLERRAVAGRDNSASKTLPNVVLGKGQDKSSYSGVSLTTSPPQTTAKMVTQDKKYPRGPSKLALGRATPSWGQRAVPTPQEPATFPPISGVKLSGGAERVSLLPLPSKQPKQTGASGKKSVTWRPREYEQVAGDDDPNRDRSPKGQIQAIRLKLSGQRMHVAQGGSGSLDIKAQKTPGDTRTFVLSQGQVMARGPARSGDLEQAEYSPGPELLHLAPESVNCPRCTVLQEEVKNLKKRIANMENLADRLQDIFSM